MTNNLRTTLAKTLFPMTLLIFIHVSHVFPEGFNWHTAPPDLWLRLDAEQATLQYLNQRISDRFMHLPELNTESIYVCISCFAFPLLLDSGQSCFWYQDHIVRRKQIIFIVRRICHCRESYQFLVGWVWYQCRRVHDLSRESNIDG